MLKNPQDRRARRTAMQIKETMLSFLERKSVHEISVSEICKVCQINRATFYDHYRDVFDLVQDLERDVLMLLEELMTRVSPEETPAEEVSRLFFGFLEENRRALKLLLGSERSREFSGCLDGILMPFFERKIRQNYRIPAGKERELHLAMRFVSSGYYRFFMEAIEDPSGREAEAALCARLSDACLETLFERRT